jgi:hypothetical protein
VNGRWALRTDRTVGRLRFGKLSACLGPVACAALAGCGGHVVSFAVDRSQNVLLAVTFSGTIDFPGATLTAKGNSDLAIAKLDPAGNVARPSSARSWTASAARRAA